VIFPYRLLQEPLSTDPWGASAPWLNFSRIDVHNATCRFLHGRDIVHEGRDALLKCDTGASVTRQNSEDLRQKTRDLSPLSCAMLLHMTVLYAKPGKVGDKVTIAIYISGIYNTLH
jgi:hypothetical protein